LQKKWVQAAPSRADVFKDGCCDLDERGWQAFLASENFHLDFFGIVFRFCCASDFGTSVERARTLIFLLTSLFIDSTFQSVATDDRCESMNNGKGE